MKTVVISGYYGYENIGDEALLASMISALRSEIQNLHIIVLSVKPEMTAARYGVEAVDRLNPVSVFAAMKRSDLLISGGGSLLQDVTGALTIPYYLGVVAMAGMMGKPVMFYAQGIGPVHGRLGRALIRLIADRVDMITLRDAASGRLLREIGVHRPPVEITADPVFGIETGNPGDPAGIYHDLGVTPPQKPAAGIFIREWPGGGGYKRAVAGLADWLSGQGREAVFIPMQFPADTSPAREIAEMMETRPLLVEKGLSFAQLMGLVSSMDIVIGMRLHALIIAAVCAVPMAGISYDPKVTDFLRQIGQPVIENLETVTSEELIEQAEKVLAKRETVRGSLRAVREELRERALRNSRVAVELLNKKK